MIIFFIFQHGEQFVFTVPDRLYMFASHAHAIGTQNTAGGGGKGKRMRVAT